MLRHRHVCIKFLRMQNPSTAILDSFSFILLQNLFLLNNSQYSKPYASTKVSAPRSVQR